MDVFGGGFGYVLRKVPGIVGRFRLGVILDAGVLRRIVWSVIVISVFMPAMMIIIIANAFREGRIRRGVHRRKLPQEGDQAPDALVVMRDTPRRHAGHLDAVLDDPERFGRLAIPFLRQVRRLRVQTLSHFVVSEPWGQVATCAHFDIVRGAQCDQVAVIEIWYDDVGRTSRNRPFPDRRQRARRHTPMRIVGCDVVAARVSNDESDAARREQNREYPNDFAHLKFVRGSMRLVFQHGKFAFLSRNHCVRCSATIVSAPSTRWTVILILSPGFTMVRKAGSFTRNTMVMGDMPRFSIRP